MTDPRRTREVDLALLVDSTRATLMALGYDVMDPDLADTPGRVARAWREFLDVDPGDTSRTFLSDMDEMIVLRGVTGWSICEHHLLPFSYTAAVAYVPRVEPDGRRPILGLSKLARIVRRHGAALQVQERMAQAIADDLEGTTHALGVGVRIVGVHLCAVMRGVRAEQAEFVTTVVKGVLSTKPEARAEFLDAVRP